MINKNIISEVVQEFYDKAIVDFMIGYHFRFIEDFETHIPRIANFWILQLNGEIIDKSDLPFHLLEVHKALPIKLGEINRWTFLFRETLQKFVDKKKLTDSQMEEWLGKVESMKQKIIAHI